MSLLFSYDKAPLLEAISYRLQDDFNPMNATAIGLVDTDGNIKTVVAYNMYDEKHGIIAMHIFSDTPLYLRPQYMREFFRYPFDQLGCVRITALVPADQPETVKLNEKIGFKVEGVARKGFRRSTDAVIMGMLRDECRWL